MELIDKNYSLELDVENRGHGLVVASAKMNGKKTAYKPTEMTVANLFFTICIEHALDGAVPRIFVTISSLDDIEPLLNLIQVHTDMDKIVIVRTGVPSVHAECRDRIKKRHIGVKLRKHMPAS